MIKTIHNSYLQLLHYTSAAYENLGIWYYAIYRSPVRRWFPWVTGAHL